MATIRFLLRAAAFILLAGAVVLAVLDAARSIAADAPVLTPLGRTLRDVAPALHDGDGGGAVPGPGGAAAAAVLVMPGFAVLGALALIFGMAGYRPENAGER